jgi:type I restriction enzyme S subunit
MVQTEFEHLPDGWEIALLGDLVDPERGISYGIVQPGFSQTDGIPIVRVNNIRDGRLSLEEVLRVDAAIEAQYRRTRLRGGEVLLTLVGTVGESAVVPAEIAGWNVARAVAVVPVLPDVNPRWVHIVLRSKPLQHLIQVWCTTTVQATFNLRDAVRLPIPIPPKSEREAIINILGSLDDKIEQNRRENETLEAMARALFKSWFVDFDPVRAKKEGRQPVGMDADTAALFPDGFEESALGPIPRGWRVGTLGEVININERSVGKDYPYREFEYIDISSVNEGRLEGTTKHSLADAPSRARRLVEDGDTIWSTVRPNRRSYLFINNPVENLVVSTGFAVLSPCYVPPSYLYAWATTDDFVEYLTFNADGSAYPAVLPERFAQAEVLVPTKELLDVFESLVGPFRDRIAHNARESIALAATRDSLLPRLLSGEIRVTN